MTIGLILETLILGPLKLLFECVFQVANKIVNNPALAIIAMSLVINILVFPLYRRADVMQEEARDIEKKLRDGVNHIKKSFSGDEKMMMLQTYYRQNNYKPTQAIKGSTSLLLQVPFFMAAYGFLSNLQALKNASLGPIADLGEPDGLLVIGGMAINVLPIIMTAINFISSTIYLKGFPLKNKIQIYGMAVFFLIFLYPSPSGLVFYWTCNNFFSLCKTILYKVKNPQRILSIIASLAGIAIFAFALFKLEGSAFKKSIIAAIGVVLQVGLFLPVIKKFASKHIRPITAKPDGKLFMAGSCFLAVLCGALISSALIADSPQEFVDVTYFYHPLWFVLSSFCYAVGTFIIWLRVFYWLSKPSVKVIFDRLVWVMSGLMVVNYMFFGRKLGTISSNLIYSEKMSFKTAEQLINIAVLVALAAVLMLVVAKWKKAAASVLVVATLAIGVMSAVNMYTIKKSVDSIDLNASVEMPNFKLNKNGKNVVVIMLDRAAGSYAPYIFNEKPELKEKFDGFTLYSNTVSFGESTNYASPPLFGGYEYTPVEMNKRDTESMAEKHNESLLVMPVLFSQNKFDVTVCDPVYANYQLSPDLSIFDDYPEIDRYITKGKFESDEQKEQSNIMNRRNIFFFSLMKCMPVAAQPYAYNNGIYWKAEVFGEVLYSTHVIESISVAKGHSKPFLKNYTVLNNMANMTQITQENKNTYLFISNDITHEPTILKAPEYVPADLVDNTQYDAEHADRFTLNGQSINITTTYQMSHYHVNMAALIQLGNWLDYLKENGVYDNTRIIIAADHGRGFHSSDVFEFENYNYFNRTAETYYPLLLVKDFDSKGFAMSDEFMTNADVPTLATQGIINNPVNPFTGKAINSDEKYAHDQIVVLSTIWNIDEHRGNTFPPTKWASVSGNLFDKKSWNFYDKEIVLKEHKLPE
ncbi:MAG: YidC/Oxa1 family membrane protein insertase [Clostridia bacterium]|nr:YidC/Oxa1 family membrane protein insertase [Clostridia bacterium]